MFRSRVRLDPSDAVNYERLAARLPRCSAFPKPSNADSHHGLGWTLE